MQALKKLLLAASLTLVACAGEGGTDEDTCRGAKCDDLGSQISPDQLMPRAPSTPGGIEITRNRDKWLFEVIGDKGEIVLLSQEYSDRASAINGALSVEENGVLSDRYRVVEAGSGWSFELVAGNSEVIAEGQVFASEAEAEAAAQSARDLVAGVVQYRAALADGAGFVLDRSGSEWSFELLDDSGEPLLVSQTYSRRRDAITGIESVRENGKNEARYQVLSNPPRFVLKARNGREIGESSSSFSSSDDAEAAVASLQNLLVTERVANPW